MRRISVGQFKSQLSEIIADVRKGERFAVEYGKRREVVAIFAPPEKAKKIHRKLGSLAGKINYNPADFKINDDEFIYSGQ